MILNLSSIARMKKEVFLLRSLRSLGTTIVDMTPAQKHSLELCVKLITYY